VDPHKGLFLPYGSGAVLVKNMDHLYQSHHYTAYYMQDADKAVTENRHASSLHSPADLSPELTKHFKGLRLWLPLKLFGLTPFKAALEEKILLARYFYEKIHAIDRFEVGPYPHLSVVIFRYVPASGRRAISKSGGTPVTPQKEEHPPAPLIRGDVNLFNEKLVEEIRKDGRVFLSSTLIDGKFYIRLAVLCFRTHLETIDLAITIIRDKVKLLLS
ncbi:MAG: hypothetical protein IIA88_07380, partial [Bacteroidetes bacterium]|nr:hypothetical protein [Bacteroidota bacterium]